jgi:hypothetical protein
MKYILFIYRCDDKKNGTEFVSGIAHEISPIVKSDEIKFIFGETNAVFHFETEMSFPELNIYMDLVSKDFENFTYFLIPKGKNFASNMEETNLNHLMDLYPNKKKRKTKKTFFELPKINFSEEEFIKNYLSSIDFKETNDDICKLTVDEILDKILDKGIDSLTVAEKNKLDEHSKNV